jgi:hypothetical protein
MPLYSKKTAVSDQQSAVSLRNKKLWVKQKDTAVSIMNDYEDAASESDADY